jgi:tetratricopeptide (TPR) repeat protein
MSFKIMSVAAAGVVVLWLAGVGAPAYAVTDDEPAPAAEPVCGKGEVFDKIKNTCVAGGTSQPCDKGFAFDPNSKTCVRTSAGLIRDDELYRQGRELALAGHYEPALGVLEAVKAKTSSVLTMIGYSTRKLGRVDEGIAIYHQALALDPGNLNTREYLGEGYLAAGRVDLAEAELDTLQNLCGVNCDQYKLLAKAIAGEGIWQH